MKNDAIPKSRFRRRILWLLVLVIPLVAMGIASVWWKRGADRAGCILNIRNYQNAIRSFSCMSNKNIGDSLDHREYVGHEKMVPEMRCPAGGTYRYLDRVPNIGELGVECSLCDKPYNHKPDDYSSW